MLAMLELLKEGTTLLKIRHGRARFIVIWHQKSAEGGSETFKSVRLSFLFLFQSGSGADLASCSQQIDRGLWIRYLEWSMSLWTMFRLIWVGLCREGESVREMDESDRAHSSTGCLSCSCIFL